MAILQMQTSNKQNSQKWTSDWEEQERREREKWEEYKLFSTLIERLGNDLKKKCRNWKEHFRFNTESGGCENENYAFDGIEKSRMLQMDFSFNISIKKHACACVGVLVKWAWYFGLGHRM